MKVSFLSYFLKKWPCIEFPGLDYLYLYSCTCTVKNWYVDKTIKEKSSLWSRKYQLTFLSKLIFFSSHFYLESLCVHEVGIKEYIYILLSEKYLGNLCDYILLSKKNIKENSLASSEDIPSTTLQRGIYIIKFMTFDSTLKS